MSIKHKQQGAALAITLILLVVGLLLSLSSMQTSRLDESMAGNQRASERALRAAEYGASKVVEVIQDKRESIDNASEASFKEALFCGESPCIEEGYNSVGDEGVYFKVSLDDGVFTRRLVAEGIVLPVDVDISALSENEIENLVVAKRYVDFSLRLEGIGKLAAFNPVCIESYISPSAAAEMTGEELPELNGGYDPAVSTGSLAEAKVVLEGVFGKSQSEVGGYVDNKDVVFVRFSDDPEFGVYHARDVVISESTGSSVTGVSVPFDDVVLDYGLCYNQKSQSGSPNKINNNMCNYVGGVGSKTSAPILNGSDPRAFHEFVRALLVDENANITGFTNPSLEYGWGNDFEFDDADGVGEVPVGVNIVTDNYHSLLSRFVEVSGSEGEGQAVSAVVKTDGEWHVSLEGYDESGNPLSPERYRVGGGLLEDFWISGDVREVVSSSDSEVLLAESDYLVGDEYAFIKSNQALVDFGSSGLGSYGLGFLPTYLPSSQDFFTLTSSSGEFLEIKEEGGVYFEYYDLGDSSLSPLVMGSDAIRDPSGKILGVNRNSLSQMDLNGAGGFLLIDGDVEFKGNPGFKGIIVVLGDFKISGGGNRNFYGATVVFPYFFNHEEGRLECQMVESDNNGMGNNDFIHQPEAIEYALSLLADETRDAWFSAFGLDGYSYVLETWRERLEN